MTSYWIRNVEKEGVLPDETFFSLMSNSGLFWWNASKYCENLQEEVALLLSSNYIQISYPWSYLTICRELFVTHGCVTGGVHTNRSLNVRSLTQIHTHMHTHTQVLHCHQGPTWRCSLQLLNAVLCRLKFRQLCSTQPVCLCVCLLPGGLVLVLTWPGSFGQQTYSETG